MFSKIKLEIREILTYLTYAMLVLLGTVGVTLAAFQYDTNVGVIVLLCLGLVGFITWVGGLIYWVFNV